MLRIRVVKTRSAHQAGVLIHDATDNLCLATQAWFQQRDAENQVGYSATSDHDSGGETPDRPFGRAFPTIASILVLVAVLSPVRENWRDRKDAVDSFPLSYYPMFSSRRADTHRQPHVVGIRSNGDTFPISYKLLGKGGMNQVRRQLGRLIKQEDSEPLQQMLAGAANEIGNSSKKRYRDCVAVAAVRGHYALDRYFSAGEKEPVRMSLLLSVPVPGRAPVDPSSLLSADES
jgi:hypothetical protein